MFMHSHYPFHQHHHLFRLCGHPPHHDSPISHQRFGVFLAVIVNRCIEFMAVNCERNGHTWVWKWCRKHTKLFVPLTNVCIFRRSYPIVYFPHSFMSVIWEITGLTWVRTWSSRKHSNLFVLLTNACIFHRSDPIVYFPHSLFVHVSNLWNNRTYVSVDGMQKPNKLVCITYQCMNTLYAHRLIQQYAFVRSDDIQHQRTN